MGESNPKAATKTPPSSDPLPKGSFAEAYERLKTAVRRAPHSYTQAQRDGIVFRPYDWTQSRNQRWIEKLAAERLGVQIVWEKQ